MDDQIRSIAEFLTKNTWSVSFLTIFGFLSALIGTWLSISSYREGQKTKKVYERLFEIAERNIDETTTEEEIEQKRKQADEMSERIISLQNQIKRDLPLEARRAVLQDRLNSSVETLTRYYQDIKLIREQLDHLGASLQIPEDLLREIESEIQPKFLLKERISSLQTGLTIITGAAATAPIFLPYPMSEWVRNLLLIISIPVILELLRLFIAISSSSLSTAKYLILALYFLDILSIIALVVLCITLPLIIIFLPSSTSGSIDTKLILIVFVIFLILCAFVLSLVSGFIYERSGVKGVIASAKTDKIFKQAAGFLDRDLYAISRRITKRIERRLQHSKSKRPR
jgi:hypothetical protein